MSTTEHPARLQGIMREAARELAREEIAALDASLSRPDEQRWLADRALRRIKWALPIGLAVFVFGLPALGLSFDMLGYINALLKGEPYIWQHPSLASSLTFAAFAYPPFVLCAVAGFLHRGSERQKRIGFWFGAALALTTLGYIAAFFLSVKA